MQVQSKRGLGVNWITDMTKTRLFDVPKRLIAAKPPTRKAIAIRSNGLVIL